MRRGMVLLLLLVNICSCYLYESSSGVSINEHLNGKLDINIHFKQQFSEQPQVAISIGSLEMEGTKFDSELLNVKPDGFTIRVTSDNLSSVSYNWLATDNPEIQIEYVQSSQEVLTVPILSQYASKNILVNSYLLGVEFDGADVKMFKHQLDSVSSQEITISTSKAKQYKLCLLISSFDNTFSTGDLGLTVKDDHPWLTRQPTDNSLMMTSYNLPADITDYVYLIGLTGFQFKENSMIRMEVEQVQQKQEQIYVQFGTWSDSLVSELNFGAMYIGNGQVTELDQKCVQLFIECNYKGQSFKICSSLDKFEFKGLVKSIHLPKGGLFTLYKQEGQEGKQIRFEESQTCMDGVEIGY